MTQRVTASAPGKLVLTGEYAVLDGAPAISAAVDLRAFVEIRSTGERWHQLIVANTGDDFAFDLSDDGSIRWRDAPGEFGTLIDAVFSILSEGGLSLNELNDSNFHKDGHAGLSISIDTRDFYQSAGAGVPKKKGVGSSAAVAVALTGALQTLAGRQPSVSSALAAHRRFQANQGSGIDVVASWLGGLVLMTGVSSLTLAWPKDFYVFPVLIGEPASTTAKLRKLENARASSPEHFTKISGDLCAAASHAARCWQGGDSEALLASIRLFADSLQRMDEELGLGIWSEPHHALKAAAAECRVVYKPSGAGGGDCGVTFSTEADALQKFADKARQLGYSSGALEWSNEGLSVARNES
jgi:phosphomevalonate kinase